MRTIWKNFRVKNLADANFFGAVFSREACEAEEDEAGDEDGEATKGREDGHLFFSSAYCSVNRSPRNAYSKGLDGNKLSHRSFIWEIIECLEPL